MAPRTTTACIRRATTMAFALMTGLAAGRPAAAEPVVIASTFDANPEGWTIAGDGSGPTWNASGGVDGGFISSTDRGQGVIWYFRAPAHFLGNRSTAYGQTLAFSLKQSATDSQTASEPDVILQGSGRTLVFDASPSPGTSWTAYVVPLVPSPQWTVDSLTGPAASEADLRAVLANLSGLQIRGEFRSGSDTGGLDSVILTLSEPPPPPTLPITSTFDLNDEGWTVTGDAQGNSDTPNYLTTGGNPGGHVTANDNATGGIWYWRAPDRYLGNIAAAYGGALSFDLKQSTLANQIDRPDVILNGNGVTLVYDTAHNPGLDWTRYVVPLSASAGWRIDRLDGPLATVADWTKALQIVTDLRIRGEFVDGDDIGGLDNVVLGGTAPLYGDADGNGAVNQGDVSAALAAAAGLRADAILALGDVAPSVTGGAFGDSRLTIEDALRIARYLNGLEPVWP